MAFAACGHRTYLLPRYSLVVDAMNIEACFEALIEFGGIPRKYQNVRSVHYGIIFYLTAPDVMPAMICFCSSTVRIRIGAITTRPAAARGPQLVSSKLSML